MEDENNTCFNKIHAKFHKDLAYSHQIKAVLGYDTPLKSLLTSLNKS